MILSQLLKTKNIMHPRLFFFYKELLYSHLMDASASDLASCLPVVILPKLS